MKHDRDYERDKAIDDIAREYHARCEAYDRSVCTGAKWKHGSVMPANGREMAIIGKHAKQVFEELASRAPCSREELHKAIQRCAK